VVGNRVRIHANAVLGSDGFGYARGPRGAVKIWHFGNVVVGDDVEIGAGATIDRGTLKDTIIDEGAKLDNLVHIGHNGYVKSHAILCAQVGLSGNVTVGSGAILAGKVGVADKIEIGDGAIIGPASGVSKDVKPGEILMGKHRAKPRREWWKLVRLFERLPELFERVKNLEQSRDGEVSASHP
jgi:UDP-3-O-[3-hydroxymyristoyl] glucosamine N-acyltransferase